MMGKRALGLYRSCAPRQWASAPAEVPAIASEVDVMLNSGRLVYERSQVDGSFQGRHHERMNQYHRGVRVFGGQLVWYRRALQRKRGFKCTNGQQA